MCENSIPSVGLNLSGGIAKKEREGEEPVNGLYGEAGASFRLIPLATLCKEPRYNSFSFDKGSGLLFDSNFFYDHYQDGASITGWRPSLRGQVAAMFLKAGPTLSYHSPLGQSKVGYHIEGGLSGPFRFKNSELGLNIDLLKIGVDIYPSDETTEEVITSRASLLNVAALVVLTVGVFVLLITSEGGE